MFIECMDFYETETGFLPKSLDLVKIDLTSGKLVVKAHEKEIYLISSQLVMAKVHRDNQGVYPFSKMDFLSHKLQEIIFPQHVPQIHLALFESEDSPIFLLERIHLDKLHIAYNLQRQIYHKSCGMDYYYDPEFLKLDENDDMDALARVHSEKVERMQRDYAYLLDKYGIAFDHSGVNITWREHDIPVSVEVHKCRRNYLFDYERCRQYLSSLEAGETKDDALTIIDRIRQLQ